MPDRAFVSDDPEYISRHKRALIAARAGLWSLLIILLSVTIIGSMAVIARIDRANEKVLDCVVPGGECYTSKVRGQSQEAITDVNVATIWCASNADDRTITSVKECIQREVRKLNEASNRNATQP